MTVNYQTTRAPERGARQPRELVAPAARQAERGVDAVGSDVTRWKPSLAHMSHELRTPIHAVLGYAALLREGAGGSLPEPAVEMVGRIARNAQQLRVLVDDILDLGRLDAGMVQPALEDVALDALLRDCMDSLVPQARARKLALRLRARCVPNVRSDPRRVWQIVINLVSNAIKFTERGGVYIELEERGRRAMREERRLHERRGSPESRGRWESPERRESREALECAESRAAEAAGGRPRFVAIHVLDTGPGIARADQDRVFDDFVQVGSAPGGTGLGLAISRRLARLLGGDLTLRSEPGRGSCFTLTLPIAGPVAAGRGSIAVYEPSTYRSSVDAAGAPHSVGLPGGHDA